MKANTETFISKAEKEVVMLRHQGNSFAVIAHLLERTISKTEQIYYDAMEKLKALEMTVPEDTQDIFPCETIDRFIDQLGIGANVLGRNVLAEAIRLSYEQPELMDSLQARFFPKLAERTNMAEALVKSRVYQTLKLTCFDRVREGMPAYIFYQRAGLAGQHKVDLKQFFLTAHTCITELHDGQSKLQSRQEA